MQSVVKLGDVMLSVIMMSIIILSDIILSVIMLSVVMLSVARQTVVMKIIVRLIVVAPFLSLGWTSYICYFFKMIGSDAALSRVEETLSGKRPTLIVTKLFFSVH
jgi:hypothetical protein